MKISIRKASDDEIHIVRQPDERDGSNYWAMSPKEIKSAIKQLEKACEKQEPKEAKEPKAEKESKEKS